MFSERVRLFLFDIVDDSDRIASFIQGLTVDDLVADDRTLLAVERLFQRITEAVIQIGADEMARIAPDLPVGKIRAFGNRLRHDYRAIDPRLLLQTACNDLPSLRAAAAEALDQQ